MSIASSVPACSTKTSSGCSTGPTVPAFSTPLTIGVRDSGVGGLTVARAIKQQLPQARLLYFADTAHVPYGDRTPDEVRYLALSITRFLIEQGAQRVVFACNTSSAYALEQAQQRFAVPLTGMIEAGGRAALGANKVSSKAPIGVLATAATVSSHMYAKWIEKLQPEAKVIEVACPEFVPLVENEQADTRTARKACEKYMEPLLNQGVQTVILGCTHYPLLLANLQAVAPHVCFVDPAHFAACEIQAQVERSGIVASAGEPDRFFVSGACDGVGNWIGKVLGNLTPDIVKGPVFTPPQFTD